MQFTKQLDLLSCLHRMFVNIHQVRLATIICSYNTTVLKNLYLIATFRLPTANFIRHMVTWHWRWAHDQNTVIGHWYARRPTIWTEAVEPTTYQWPMTVLWSRAHRQRHVTICLMKLAVGERNVTFRYRFLRMVVLHEYIIVFTECNKNHRFYTSSSLQGHRQVATIFTSW